MNFPLLVSMLIRWLPQILSVVSAVLAAMHQQQAATVAELSPLLPEDAGVQVVQGLPFASIIGYVISGLSLIGGGLVNKPKPPEPAVPSAAGLVGLLLPLLKSVGSGLSAASIQKLVTLALDAVRVLGEIAQIEAAQRLAKKSRAGSDE